jgi:hypothetical protein
MPLPTSNDVHVNVPLSNIAEKFYLGDNDPFVADKVFPIVPVRKLSDLIAQYNRKDWFNAHDVRPRHPGTESQGVGYHVATSLYYRCLEYANHVDVADEIRANADAPFQMDTDAVQVITQRLKIKRDYLFAQQAFVPGIWSNAGGFAAGAWNVAGSTPIADIDNAKTTMLLGTGFLPNTLLVNYNVYNALRNHATIVARYTGNGQPYPRLTQQQVADVLDVERIIVAWGVYDTGPMEGQWDGRWLFGNHALLCYSPPAPSTMQPAAGYTFSYTAANHAGLNIQIEQFRMANDAKADRVIGNIHFDVAVCEQDLGVFWQNAVAGAGVLNQVVLDVTVGVP